MTPTCLNRTEIKQQQHISHSIWHLLRKRIHCPWAIIKCDVSRTVWKWCQESLGVPIPFSQHDRLRPQSASDRTVASSLYKVDPTSHGPRSPHAGPMHSSDDCKHPQLYWFSSSLSDYSLIRLTYHLYKSEYWGQQTFTVIKIYAFYWADC